MNRGWWVFGAGGLFTLKAVEDPPLAHICPGRAGIARRGPERANG